MEWLLYSSGIVAAVAMLAAAITVTLLIYFKLCAVHPAHKLRVDVGLVAFVAALSLAVRVTVCIIVAPQASFSGGFSDLFVNVFYTVAGLTFNGDFADAGNGLLACLYYGVVVYASLVFLTAITAGVSYEIYSKIQLWAARNLLPKNTYYVFTSITQDSLLLADSIKRKHKENKKRLGRCTVIFFEQGEEAFSRKNPLHRALMKSGFYFLSDSRRNDSGGAVCLLKKLKLHPRLIKRHDTGEAKDKIFHVFAIGSGGDYEGDNAQTVYDDFKATVNAFYKKKDGEIICNLPIAVNYHLLTGGEINFESYDRNTDLILGEWLGFNKNKEAYIRRGTEKSEERLKELESELQNADSNKEDIASEINELKNDRRKSAEEYAEAVYKNDKEEIRRKLPVHVFNEASLSSLDMVYERKNRLDKLGDVAFERESAPDKDGAYRVAVIGFGKTGQYAMEELYVHTAHLVKNGGAYLPVQFIADVYDYKIDEKSGLFAYNHPLFRCVNDGDVGKIQTNGLSDTKKIIEAAKTVKGKAFDILYSECEEKTGRDKAEAKEFVDSRMGFPIVYMHKEQCFKYPFIDGAGAEAAIQTARRNNVRAFVVALGNDESNIAMANVLIDSFRRSLLKDYLAGKKSSENHIIIYVNLIEERSKVLLNWNWDTDADYYGREYVTNDKGEIISSPGLSVIPFGCREAMYSYDALVEDYNERVYNYGYGLLSDILEKKDKAKEAYDVYKNSLAKDRGCYRADGAVMEKWKEVPQFLRLSNKSANAFAVNYHKFKKTLGRDLKPYGEDAEDNAKWEFLVRLEHERWDRFFIAHGWVYSPYNKFDDLSGLSKAKKKRIKDGEKNARRGVRQHNCLCPFDEMLDDYTKLYDKGNVELGFIDRIVYPK